MRRRLLASAGLALLGALGITAAAHGANPPAPTAPDQPLRDGCQRNYSAVIFLKSPEWMYVYRDSSIHQATGIVRVSHVARDDAPGEHAFHDYNANLVPDGGSRYVLGGDPSAHTSNYAPGGPDEAESLGRLHFEWESGATVPAFAWPTDGDRTTMWGSWIWDCGHWQDAAGSVTGERTEFHPLTGMVIYRRAPYLPHKLRTQTDVFISSQGTLAHAVQACGARLKPISPTEYGPDLRACVQAPQNQRQPVARSYSFFVPAPPRPSRRAKLTFEVRKMIPGTGRQQVKRKKNGLQVTVFPAAGAPPGATVRYGRTFLVGWKGRERRHPVRLKITFKSITIVHKDPDLSADPSSGKWNLYLDVNGFRALFNDWIPTLGAVSDGQRIPINHTVTINVPPGRSIKLLVQGRECDIPSGKVVFGEFAPVVRPCPVNTDEPTIDLANDDPGIVLDVFNSPRAALGNHTAFSVATTNRFPGSGPITFKDGKQGAGDYVLSYNVRRG